MNVTSIEPSKVTSIYGEKLKKVITRTPHDVGELREKVSKHYEADIPYPRRFMIDYGLYSGFELPVNTKIVRPDDIVPIDYFQEPRIVITDIEVYTKGRFPNADNKEDKIILICIYDSQTGVYYSLIVDPKGKRREHKQISETHRYSIFPNEVEMLRRAEETIKYLDPDIYTAWYVSFDKDYQDIRNSSNNISISWKRTNVFDMLKAYKVLYGKSSGKLADVLIDEELDIPNYEPWQQQFWEKDIMKAILVNKSHVEACVELNKKYNLMSFYWELKNLSGLDSLDPTVWHGALIENLFLRVFNGKYVIPSRPSKKVSDERAKIYAPQLTGGKVFTPPVGIWDDIGNFDMTRYYPEMLISMKLSPEPHKDIGEIPKLALELIKKRLEYDNKLSKLIPGTPEHKNLKRRRLAVKDAVQTIVGYFGDPKSRLFDPDIFNKVTTTGQKGLLFLADICKEDGHKFVYGDTDSTLIQIPLEKAHKYVHKLNNSLKDFCKKEKIDRELSLKMDRYFKRIIFKRKKGTNEGVKKRYAGRVCLADLKKNIIWTTIGKNKSVCDVKVGDRLIAFNKGKFVETEVKEIFERKTTDYLRIILEKNDKKRGSKPAGDESNAIIVTPEHPFYVKGKWKHAKNLKVGDELLFLTRNDKQRLQMKYDEGFREDKIRRRVKANKTKRMRDVSRRNITKWMKENPEEFKKAIEKGVANRDKNSIKKFKETFKERNLGEKYSKRMKEMWTDPNSVFNTKEYMEKTVNARLTRPTYLEAIFIYLFHKYDLPIDYVGDGRFFIGSNKKVFGHYHLNPDFLVRDQKKVIEVYGHKLRQGEEKDYDRERKRYFGEYGYECLCLCVNPKKVDEEKIYSEVNTFLHNGVKIKSIKKSRVKNVNAINFHCEPYNNFFVNGVLTHNCWEDGKDVDYIYVRGFEYVRRDASKLTKEIQHKMFELLLYKTKEDVLNYLRKRVTDIQSGKFSLEEIAVPKTLHKNPKDYSPPQDYVRGALYTNRWLSSDIHAEDVIKMFYVKSVGKGFPSTDVISVLSVEDLPSDIEIDIPLTIEKTIQAKIEDLMELVDLKWRDIFQRQVGLF